MKVENDVLVIHNWFIHNECVIGQIYNDERKWKKRFQMTSLIVELNEDEGILKTLNSVYHLGKPLNITCPEDYAYLATFTTKENKK